MDPQNSLPAQPTADGNQSSGDRGQNASHSRPRHRRPQGHRPTDNQSRPQATEQSQPNNQKNQPAPDTNQVPEAGFKKTNQYDRYLRPSLASHGARAAEKAYQRPSDQGTKPIVHQTNNIQPAARNPRLAEDAKPMIIRKPTKPSSQQRPSNNIAHRRFPISEPAAQPQRNPYKPTAVPVTVDGPKQEVRPQIVAQGGRNQLRIIPLGGAGEIGSKNMTVFEYGGDIIVIDCGIGFADSTLPGVDALIPDTKYLEERKGQIRGMIFTHGHEDHIGSTAYIWPKLNCPIYASPMAGGLIEHKFEEAGVTGAKITIIGDGDKLHFGKFSVEVIHLVHSIPDALGLAIRCPAGLFFLATDWRLDHTPVLGKPTDWTRIAQLAGEGITCLLSDSTNVDRAGWSGSETVVGETIDHIFQEAPGRIIIAQFASNINRIQQVINSAKKFNRKLAISGRSMETYINIAMNLGYLKVPEGMMVDLRKINTVDPRRLAILSTGSQGEEFSSLTRISSGEHRHVKLEKTDTIVLSSSVIPGNEGTVGRVVDNLCREGVRIINNKILSDVHVTGHATREELKLMIAICQPDYFIPIHGDYHNLVEHGEMAVDLGVKPEHVLIMENGDVIEFDDKGGRKSTKKIEVEDVMVDGLGIGDIGPIVIRDRQILGSDGVVSFFLAVKKGSGELLNSPDVVTRGFIYIRESEALMRGLREEIKKAYADNLKRVGPDWDELKDALRDDISQYLSQATGRNPMILPVITVI